MCEQPHAVGTPQPESDMPLDGTNPIIESAYCHHRHHLEEHSTNFFTCPHAICANARRMWKLAVGTPPSADDQTDQEEIIEIDEDGQVHSFREVDRLRAELTRLRAERDSLKDTIQWVLGEHPTDEFPGLPDDWPARKFYWRSALRARLSREPHQDTPQ